MCLYTNKKLMTAKQDLHVFKVLERDWSALYYNFDYKPKVTYRLRKKLKPVLVGDNVKMVLEGFHTSVTLRDAEEKWLVGNRIVVEAIIPKGAKYYLGDDNDIVSTSLRIPNAQPVRKKGRGVNDILSK